MRLLLTVFFLFFATHALAGSSYTPRDSGTEPHDGPRAPEALPSRGSFGRTAEGGMGYVDAYGNSIQDRVEEKKPRQRLRPGAYGQYGQKDPYNRPLPDPTKQNARPVWSF
ncbi:MAG: translation initiation factor IF-2 [Desulfovibrio sp.]|nr:translation initiation factor IF-2 [Desulfovibrio sp.]